MTNISAPGAQWQQQPTSTNNRSKYFQIPIVYDGSLDFLGIAPFYGNFPDFVGRSPLLNFKSQLSMIIHNFLRSSRAQAAAAAMDPGGLNGGAGLGGGIPESTRYPWMSITGRSVSWD